MKYPLIKTVAIYLLTALPLLANAANTESIHQTKRIGWRRHRQIYPRRF